MCFPQGAAGQSESEASVPTHPTSSSQMGPAPHPKRPTVGSGCRAPPQPSSRQTTAESRRSQLSSHTVPQRPACHTSNRPEHLLDPATRRSWGDPGVKETQRIRVGNAIHSESSSAAPPSIFLPSSRHLMSCAMPLSAVGMRIKHPAQSKSSLKS